MTLSDQDARNIETAKEYFRRGDAQDPTLFDLFHPDLRYYFPKFGVGRGPDSVKEMFGGFVGELEAIKHDFSSYLFVARHPYVIVEGTTKGRMKGQDWEAGKTPGGRFCNVFEFKDGLIARCFVYLDPDYIGEDKPRFRWGTKNREW